MKVRPAFGVIDGERGCFCLPLDFLGSSSLMYATDFHVVESIGAHLAGQLWNVIHIIEIFHYLS